MKKIAVMLITTMLMNIGIQTISAPIYSDTVEVSAWVLYEVIDYDLSKIDVFNKNNTQYALEGTYSQNDFTIKHSYIGKTDKNTTPNKINGESNTTHAAWSQPPSIIRSGEAINITLSLSTSSNSLSFFSFAGSARAFLDNGNFSNAAGEHLFSSEKKNNYMAVNETVSATAGSGREGDEMRLRFTLYDAVQLETIYVYKWQKTDEVIDASEPEKTAEVIPFIDEVFVVAKTEAGEYKESGARVSDITGEVLIRHGDDRLGWDYLDVDMVINEGDVIWTKSDAYVKLSLHDMTTFEMRPNSQIIMNTGSERESKLALLFGKVLANVKKMVVDGTMQVEMSQGICGIKGTTFIVEDDGLKSTLKVIEGTVSFAAYGQEEVYVTDGQMAFIENGTLSHIEMFSLQDELNTWDLKTQKAVTLKFTIGSPNVNVSGMNEVLDVAPFIVNGRTQVPLRLIGEKLGATIGWNNAERMVTYTTNDVVIKLWIDKTIATVNGVSVTLDAAPFIVNGRTVVPIRFVSENLGASVEWISETKEIIITK